MAFREFISRGWQWAKKAILYFLISSILSVIIFRFVPIPFTPLMIIRVVEQVFSNSDIVLKKNWESLASISPQLPLAVIASEDQLFLTHHGFDFTAMQKAWQSNGKKRKTFRGASTLTQQVAKNVFLWPGRSYLRKALEAYFTVLIELFWSKQRIIEVYLNVAELGNGVYGVEACSQKCFSKPAKSITRSQAALIASVLPNPRRWSPAKPTSYIYKRQAWIVRNMNNLGILNW